MLLPHGLDVSGEFAWKLPSSDSDGINSSLQQQRGAQVTPCAVPSHEQCLCWALGVSLPALGGGIWGLAKIPVSSLVSGSPGWSLSGTDWALLHWVHTISWFPLSQDKSKDFFFAIPVFSFSPLDVVRQHPWNSCSISKCLLEVLSWHLRAVLSSPLARQVLRNMCC